MAKFLMTCTKVNILSITWFIIKFVMPDFWAHIFHIVLKKPIICTCIYSAATFNFYFLIYNLNAHVACRPFHLYLLSFLFIAATCTGFAHLPAPQAILHCQTLFLIPLNNGAKCWSDAASNQSILICLYFSFPFSPSYIFSWHVLHMMNNVWSTLSTFCSTILHRDLLPESNHIFSLPCSHPKCVSKSQALQIHGASVCV